MLKKYFAWLCYPKFFEGKLKVFFSQKQAWILAPDIGQCPVKNRVISGKTASERTQLLGMKLQNLSYRRLKTTKHSLSIGHSCSGFFMSILIDNLLMQFFIFKTIKLGKKDKNLLYQCFVFLPCLKKLPLWKHFILVRARTAEPCTAYNQKSHFLLVVSGTITTYSTSHITFSLNYFNLS